MSQEDSFSKDSREFSVSSNLSKRFAAAKNNGGLNSSELPSSTFYMPVGYNGNNGNVADANNIVAQSNSATAKLQQHHA